MSRSTATRLRPAALVSLLSLALALPLASCSGDSGDGPVNPGTAKELNSPTLGSGGSYAHAFANAGTYPYHCAIHSSMTGSVSVAVGGADSALVSITGSSFAPQNATVKPGGTVRWANSDGIAHTVTSD